MAAVSSLPCGTIWRVNSKRQRNRGSRPLPMEDCMMYSQVNPTPNVIRVTCLIVD